MNPITIRILALVAGLFTLAILPSAASAGDWGAIALSTRTGAWGTARNYDDEDEARARDERMPQARERLPGIQDVREYLRGARH